MATLRREEGRFVKGSITFANPKKPHADPPPRRRADYPVFTKFEKPVDLTVQSLVKLACAIDQWSGSIAVYPSRRSKIVAWGVVDQLVQENKRINREVSGGFSNPGLLTVVMDGVGDISAYHGSLFLGGLKAQSLVTRESDALGSMLVAEYVAYAFEPFAKAIHRVVGGKSDEMEILDFLVRACEASIARLCIGLKQRGTGGAFLLTPTPMDALLAVKHAFEYPRLMNATILRVLDEESLRKVWSVQNEFIERDQSVPGDLVRLHSRAETDADDREDEVTGAVKLVASLAALDGLVLLSPTLAVRGFGVKIGAAPNVSTVYDGEGFSRRGTKARKIDLSKFGTRHGSMLRYCAQDRKALGVVVSQDGYVRLMMTVGNSLLFWDNLKLLGHDEFSRKAAIERKKRRESRRTGAKPLWLGYTEMPKTVERLLKEGS
ncbi:hypothetical protein FXB40_39195 [Bradyrhizobium rifense]|uniref:Probable sensor domain-containing protein n=1 Tax=Bradyrhizobium rifense TaxID=515499 RepID=A0A5D3K5T9_9BRAD|nr:hypothetical protein [Bradyrhizobium rifense]TYL88052.1 hypothetical protein FXB40_39195 [Bradyrhizobium rifense]